MCLSLQTRGIAPERHVVSVDYLATMRNQSHVVCLYGSITMACMPER